MIEKCKTSDIDKLYYKFNDKSIKRVYLSLHKGVNEIKKALIE